MGLPATGPRSAASGGHGTNRAESTLVSQQQREKNRSFFGITYQSGMHVTSFVPMRLIPLKIFFPFSETMVL